MMHKKDRDRVTAEIMLPHSLRPANEVYAPLPSNKLPHFSTRKGTHTRCGNTWCVQVKNSSHPAYFNDELAFAAFSAW